MDDFEDAWGGSEADRRDAIIVYDPDEGLTDDQRRRLDNNGEDDPPLILAPDNGRRRNRDD